MVRSQYATTIIGTHASGTVMGKLYGQVGSGFIRPVSSCRDRVHIWYGQFLAQKCLTVYLFSRGCLGKTQKGFLNFMNVH
jgi:hypothetical protein